MYFQNMFENSCDKKKNFNKEIFLLIKEFLVYNIVWLGKSNLIFTRTQSWSNLNYKFF